MRKNSYLLSLFLIFFGISSCTSPPTGKIILSKTEFSPGEEIKLNFTTEGTFGENPWIGIIETQVLHGNEELNDTNDLGFKYFDGVKAGKMVLTAPEKPRKYDLRMFSADKGGVEVTSVTFTVVAPSTTRS